MAQDDLLRMVAHDLRLHDLEWPLAEQFARRIDAIAGVGPDLGRGPLRTALLQHHPIARTETGPLSGCRCGEVRLGQDVIGHVMGKILDAMTAEPAAPPIDWRPHSRACGILRHEHGTACSSNCPTCGGRNGTALVE